MSINLPPNVIARLQTNTIVWLNSVRPDGRPHSVAVWFLWDETSTLILTNPSTQKVRNIRHNPAVILALDDTQHGRDVITLAGRATLPAMSDVSASFPAYGEKYGARIREIRASAATQGAAQNAGYSQPIVVTITRLLHS